MKFASKWIELENAILSKVTQTQKDKHGYVLTHKWKLEITALEKLGNKKDPKRNGRVTG